MSASLENEHKEQKKYINNTFQPDWSDYVLFTKIHKRDFTNIVSKSESKFYTKDFHETLPSNSDFHIY
jgi:uncharacterized membrane protein